MVLPDPAPEGRGAAQPWPPSEARQRMRSPCGTQVRGPELPPRTARAFPTRRRWCADADAVPGLDPLGRVERWNGVAFGLSGVGPPAPRRGDLATGVAVSADEVRPQPPLLTATGTGQRRWLSPPGGWMTRGPALRDRQRQPPVRVGDQRRHAGAELGGDVHRTPAGAVHRRRSGGVAPRGLRLATAEPVAGGRRRLADAPGECGRLAGQRRARPRARRWWGLRQRRRSAEHAMGRHRGPRQRQPQPVPVHPHGRALRPGSLELQGQPGDGSGGDRDPGWERNLSRGSFGANVAAITGWTGAHHLVLRFWAVGNGQPLVVSGLSFASPSARGLAAQATGRWLLWEVGGERTWADGSGVT